MSSKFGLEKIVSAQLRLLIHEKGSNVEDVISRNAWCGCKEEVVESMKELKAC